MMLSYLMVFSAGVLAGSMLMGLYVALVNRKDARDEWESDPPLPDTQNFGGCT